MNNLVMLACENCVESSLYNFILDNKHFFTLELLFESSMYY